MLPIAKQPDTRAAEELSAEVFISYSSQDRQRANEIARLLRQAAITVWLDHQKIGGGATYGFEIVQAIKSCRILAVLCSDASLHSRNVTQEILLAWQYEKYLLPLRVSPLTYTEQVEYWLAGRQWIDVFAQETQTWLPKILQAVHRLRQSDAAVHGAQTPLAPRDLGAAPSGLDGLFAAAAFTNRLWPLPAAARQAQTWLPTTRDMGAVPYAAQHQYALNSRVCLALEVERPSHLLLLNAGTSGTVYCLCPSQFAPQAYLQPGLHYFPQAGAYADAFVITGATGRERLLAILTDDPLEPGWLSPPDSAPARRLTPADIDQLLQAIGRLSPTQWVALATQFNVI